MSDTMIFLALIAIMAVAMFGIARADARRRRIRRQRTKAYKAMRPENVGALTPQQILDAPRTTDTDESYEKLLTAEQRTRRLIGNDAYEEMVARVDRILDAHRNEQSVNVMLTSGPDTAQGKTELHRLLPGDPLWLRKTMDGGMAVVDVYSGGFRIGRLLLEDAARVLRVMDTAVVTGSYVAEQNSWGDCPEVSLGIIVFHSTREEFEARLARNDQAVPYRITIDGPQRIVLYQN